jgi:SAM-dependent methyltransferase
LLRTREGAASLNVRRKIRGAVGRVPVIRRLTESQSLDRLVRAEPNIHLKTDPDYDRWDLIIPIPPETLRRATGPGSLERFLVVGDAWNQVVSRFIVRPDSRVLDIGCGCGKLARFLATNPHVETYVGFDAMPEGVAWCENFITPLTDGRFDFHHYDIYSKTYNSQGSMRASEVVFPADDGSVDVVAAASLFTHLLEKDAKHYLQEVHRVLKPEGLALASVHVAPPPGVRYFGDEERIDVELGYFLELASERGLGLIEDLGDVCGQRTLVLAVA